MAAAQAHEKKYSCKNTVDIRRIAGDNKASHDDYKSAMSLFVHLGLNFSVARNRAGLLGFLDLIASISGRFAPSPLKRAIGRYLYTSRELGFDSMLNSKNIYVRGYFQTWRYFDALETRPIRETSTFAANFRLKLAASSTEGSIVLHVRRGDYVEAASHYGLLAAEWYRIGVSKLRINLPDAKVVLYSECAEAELDQDFQKLITDYDVTYIDTGDLPAAEVLLAMAHGAGYVIANSSFSWWAATLSGSKSVVAPYPWFKGIPEPSEIVSPNWTRLDSVWLDT